MKSRVPFLLRKGPRVEERDQLANTEATAAIPCYQRFLRPEYLAIDLISAERDLRRCLGAWAIRRLGTPTTVDLNWMHLNFVHAAFPFLTIRPVATARSWAVARRVSSFRQSSNGPEEPNWIHQNSSVPSD